MSGVALPVEKAVEIVVQVFHWKGRQEDHLEASLRWLAHGVAGAAFLNSADGMAGRTAPLEDQAAAGDLRQAATPVGAGQIAAHGRRRRGIRDGGSTGGGARRTR